jgi:error-prone DNA polymerase
MVAVKGPVQREGDFVHLIVQRVTDLSGDLACVGERDVGLPVPHGRGDQATHGGSERDPRQRPSRGWQTSGIRPKTRDFL